MSWILACALVSDTDLTARMDLDGDGLPRGEDCDDDAATVGSAVIWYADGDGDGYGASASTPACTQPDGYIAQGGDCDDRDASVNPSVLWYVDADADGYGGARTTASCLLPAGYVKGPGDCNDADATISPTMPETCDGRDDDCSGVVDDPGEAEVCGDGLDNDCVDGDAICLLTGADSMDDAQARVFGTADHILRTAVGVGDVSGDGAGDLFVGVQCCNGWGFGLLHGPVYGDHVIDAADVLVEGAEYSMYLGMAAAGADLDGDGKNDLVVGVPGWHSVLVWLEPPVSGGTGSADLEFEWDYVGFGRVLTPAGDVDGDGYADILTGASYMDESGPENCCGAVGLLHGGAFDHGADLILGEAEGDSVGTAIAGGGDVDGDGFDDVLVGASGVNEHAGAVGLFLGGSNWGMRAFGSADTMVTSESQDWQFGLAVAMLGDSDDDGYADGLIGHYSSGIASLFTGPMLPGQLSEADAQTTFGGAGTYGWGSAVANAGDVDGDGQPDVMVSDMWEVGTDGLSDGLVGVYFAPFAAGLVDITDADALLWGPHGGGMAGDVVGSAADLEADGYGDLFVGGMRDDTNGENTGTVWIFQGGG